MPDINQFQRISKLPPYVFAEINKIRDEKRRAGEDIIDFGMGNPAFSPPKKVIEKLGELIKNEESHKYTNPQGIIELRDAYSKYYKKRFSVDICPENEISISIGSKEGISSLALAISCENTNIIVSDPCYPIHKLAFEMAGANVISIKNSDAEEYFQKFQEIVHKADKKIFAIIVNYPSNPSAETVNLDFYQRLVKFCKTHSIYIISDLAYSEIYYQEKTPSILEVEGAKDVAIEFSSISKTYSMAGWRIGFATGNKFLISALTKIKSYLDYGNFSPLQYATITALEECDEYVANIRQLYKKRRDVFVEELKNIGWTVTTPKASMFIWTKIPDEYKQLSSLEFSKLLIEKIGIIVAPGSGFGDGGEGFIRISLIENEDRIKEAVKRMRTLF